MSLNESASAASLITEARQRAKLTQYALAKQSGVKATLISQYENGDVQPSLPRLRLLIEAAGFKLRVEVSEV